jgi:SlyX protein
MSDSVEVLARRLVELEVRYTHQQDVIEKLSDALYQQQRVIDSLKSRLESVEERGGGDEAADAPADAEADRPPHY